MPTTLLLLANAIVWSVVAMGVGSGRTRGPGGGPCRRAFNPRQPQGIRPPTIFPMTRRRGLNRSLVGRNPDRFARALCTCQVFGRRGYPCQAHYCLLGIGPGLGGGPGETEDSVWRALDFLDSVAPDDPLSISMGIGVYKGTAVEETARREGRLAPDQNMLTPAYYLSSALDESLMDRLDEYCEGRPNWFTAPTLMRRMQQETGR